MSQPPTVPFDSIADTYDATRGGPARGDRFAAVIDDLLGPGESVLELGVGTGLVAAALDARGRQVVGIDVSARMLSYASNRLPGRVILADASRLPFRSGSFDGCYAVWMLHLVRNVRAAVEEARRVLRPARRFVVAPANNSPGQDPIGRLVYAMQQALLGQAADHGGTDEVVEIAAGCGLKLVARRTIEQSYPLAPNEMAATIERRNFSSLASVDDEQWATIVRPTIDALRVLPDPDRPVERRTVHDVLALQTPDHP